MDNLTVGIVYCNGEFLKCMGTQWGFEASWMVDLFGGVTHSCLESPVMTSGPRGCCGGSVSFSFSNGCWASIGIMEGPESSSLLFCSYIFSLFRNLRTVRATWSKIFRVAATDRQTGWALSLSLGACATPTTVTAAAQWHHTVREASK